MVLFSGCGLLIVGVLCGYWVFTRFAWVGGVVCLGDGVYCCFLCACVVFGIWFWVFVVLVGLGGCGCSFVLGCCCF